MVGRQALRRLKQNDELEQLLSKLSVKTSLQEENKEQDHVSFEKSNVFAILQDEVNEEETDTNTESVSNDKVNMLKNRKKAKVSKISSKRKNNGDNIINEITASSEGTVHFDDCTKKETQKTCLLVDGRNLNPKTEIRRIFGKTALDGGNATKSRRTVRKVVFLDKKPTWPPYVRVGLRMERVGGSNIFQYEHKNEYKQTEQELVDAVLSFNHETMMKIHNLHPYHVDTLLQLSELFNMGDDVSAAADLIERAVFSLQSSFHPLFRVSDIECKLSYEQFENRSFFLAIFKYAYYLSSRSCPRTALELCKMLLNLDRTDPLAILLILDYYAIKAGEYKFLIDFFEEVKDLLHLADLPNFAFSIPYCMFHSGVDEKICNESLKNAILKFPQTFLTLVDKCSIEPDAQIIEFLNSFKADPESLDIISRLFVVKVYRFWKNMKVLRWLETTCNELLNSINEQAENISAYSEMRQKVFRRLPVNICRHIVAHPYTSEMRPLIDHVSSVPQNVNLNAINPFPPDNDPTFYPKQERTLITTSEYGSNILAFIQSVLPSYNLTNTREGRAERNQQLADEELNDDSDININFDFD